MVQWVYSKWDNSNYTNTLRYAGYRDANYVASLTAAIHPIFDSIRFFITFIKSCRDAN